MAIYREKRKQRFTVIDNQPLQDANLSNKALGLLVRMLSFPDDWKFYEKDLEKRCNKDGRDAIHNQLLELQKAGYVTKVRNRSKDGKFAQTDLIVHEQPQPEKEPKPELKPEPSTGNPSTVNPSTGNPSTVNPSTGNPSTVNPSTEKPLTDNPHLQNTNITKYSTNKKLNKSSSSSSSSVEDPFKPTAKTKEEEDQKISELIEWFIERTDVTLTNPQYNQINKKLHSMSLANATDLMHQVVDAMTSGIRDPAAYLIKSLMNAS